MYTWEYYNEEYREIRGEESLIRKLGKLRCLQKEAALVLSFHR